MTERIGWIGTGVMGEPCCGHLLEAGYPLTVTSRTRSKVLPLLDRGATWRDTPRGVAAQSDVIFTMVGTPDEVRSVYFGEQGVLAGIEAGAILVDMGTTPPSLARDIAAAAAGLGASAIDAPVSGGDVGARNGRLAIMAGGDAGTIESVRHLFECFGSVTVMGPAGSGQHTKMCNQVTVAGTMIGVCEALLYARAAGVDAGRLVATISQGAAACWTLDTLAPRINRGDYDPGFMVDHFVKDLGIALREAESMGLELPGLRLANELYTRLQDMGQGASGTQALVLALEAMNTK